MERPRDHCIRCGECCLRSSPSLQITDAPLVYESVIKRSDLYSVRVGELVQDNIRDELKVTDTELIKVREKESGGGCIFYDDAEKKCTIYGHRRSTGEYSTCSGRGLNSVRVCQRTHQRPSPPNAAAHGIVNNTVEKKPISI